MTYTQLETWGMDYNFYDFYSSHCIFESCSSYNIQIYFNKLPWREKQSSACIGVGSTAEVADSQWEMVEGISYMWDNAKCNLKEKISTMKQKQFDRYREWTDGY